MKFNVLIPLTNRAWQNITMAKELSSFHSLNPVNEPGVAELYLCNSLIVNSFFGTLLRSGFPNVSPAFFFITPPHFSQ